MRRDAERCCVEIDETYIGGKNTINTPINALNMAAKVGGLGMRERGGKIKAYTKSNTTTETPRMRST